MSIERDKFRQALRQADTGEIDMSDVSLAQAIGVMHDYGHGYEWDLPVDDDGWIDVPAIVKIIEDYVKGEDFYN